MRLGAGLLVMGLLIVSTAHGVKAADAESAATNAATPETANPDAVKSDLLGRKIDAFALKDYRGKETKLSEFEQPLLVVTFLGCECPLAKLYGPRLAELAKQFDGKGVGFVGIDSNRQDSVTELAAYARVHNIEFPLLKDLGNQVADQFGATRTPQVFLLDKDRVVRYVGRIDDQFGFATGVGYQKPKLTRADLSVAIEELQADKPISVPYTEFSGCLIGRVRQADDSSTVTYSNQIARIMQKHCVECHRPNQIAPFSLTSYDEVAGWAEMITEVVREQRMPPWHANPEFGHFSNDIRLSEEDKNQIYAWATAGAPEGDVGDLPEPISYPEGWLMPQQPDVVIKMDEGQYDVASEGTVEYQYFEVDPGFTEDKWVKIAECRPENRAVVHHIIAFVRPPKGYDSGDKDVRGFHFLAGFAPGTRPFVYPDGMAKKIPAGSKIVFQLHYTPIGTAQKDCSMLGLKFVEDPKSIKYQVATTNAINAAFEIPAGADNHPVEATRPLQRSTTLLSLFPHMHLRGKSFYYEAQYPDGTKEVLLDVPHYDFNWQNHFILDKPKELPKGTKVYCLAHFDNSENNLANPDPKSAVRWGDQTWEEMMIGWFDIAMPVNEAGAIIASPGEGGDDASDSAGEDNAAAESDTPSEGNG